MKKLLCAIVVLCTTTLMAQTTVTGTVTDEATGQPIPGANVKVVGKSLGTSADFDGKFTLNVSQDPPFVIEVSIMGYSASNVEVTSNDYNVDVVLVELATSLDEVVVSASRTPERIMESPVTIERMDARAVKNTSSPTFYDGLENLKGVDMNTNSLTYKSVNTRGFATFANTRFMQLVDGMDNSSPALNFALGNLLGMSELDVNTVEVLPGAASALYGANAFNGIMFMTSKNPFESAGWTMYGKTGLTSSKDAGDNNFYDFGFRGAWAFSEKFAAKASFSFLKGTEWYATDYRDYNHSGSQAGLPTPINPETGQPTFDRLNVYGDEVAINIHDVALSLESIGLIPGGSSNLIPSEKVSRTGYKEKDLTDYDAQSVKADFSLNYRPMADDFEIILNAKFGKGNTIYQGANRYNIKNFLMSQFKLEVKNDNFFVRAYTTREDAGDSYDMRFTGINMNLDSAPEWFGTYVGAYLQAVIGGASSAQAHSGARQFSDANITLQPGTPEFDTLLKKITTDPNLETGSKFQDKTSLVHVDGNYNFSHLMEWADIQVGGSWREYSLNSNGTIFTDYDGAIKYNEYGGYVQLQKKFMDDRLKFTGSIRYDKAQNFDSNTSPRLSLVYSAGENRNHNFRAAFQTGFRNPTTQDQYIGLNAGAALLVGSAPDNLDRYVSGPINISASGQALGFPSTLTIGGRNGYENSWSLSSVQDFAASAAAGAPNPGLLDPTNTEVVKPEQVTAFEVGYRGVVQKITIDFSAYYNKYKDFIGNKTAIAPLYGAADLSDGGLAVAALANGDTQPFSLYTNSSADVSSYGVGIGLNRKVWNGYNIGVNYTWSGFDFNQASVPDYEAGFNTPEHQVKGSFSNPNAIANFGFGVNVRWSNAYLWESTFADAVIAERTVVDAQISYTVPNWKSTFKAGGANLGGKEYLSAPGNGIIESQYFVSWTMNP